MRNRRILAVLGSLLLVGMTVTAVAQKRQNSSEREGSPRQVTEQEQHTIQDANGDGLCDVCKDTVGSGRQNAQGQKADKGKHWGPGDGSGQTENPPKDGTGYGADSGKHNGSQDGSGNQDGSGMQRGAPHEGSAQPGTGGSSGRGKGRGRN